MKRNSIIYTVTTGLLSAMMLMSAGMYFFNHGQIAEAFTSLGYPTYLIYPLATAKLLGLAAIWSGFSPLLRNLAYAGFFYDFVLGASAHLAVGDGQAGMAIGALVLLGASYWSQRLLGVERLTSAAAAPSAA
ncbi:MAG: DoxX family protein [Deltaproteobacteria bacterium]|nr:DoxX family protein [Deltaproteobacteria bacterium]